MHELAVTEASSKSSFNLLKKTELRSNRYQPHHRALSSIVNDSVQFYWDHISKGSIAEEAKLHFNRILAKLKCLSCGNEFQLIEELTPCPNCHSINLQIIAGEEFQVDAIEIEKEDNNEPKS